MNTWSKLSLSAVFLALSACGTGIEGDWFRCQSASCETLSDDGLRFRDDDSFVALESTGSTLEPDEMYCETTVASGKGTYVWDGSLLTTRPASGGEEQVEFVIDGDQATVTIDQTSSKWARIAEPRSVGICDPNRRS